MFLLIYLESLKGYVLITLIIHQQVLYFAALNLIFQLAYQPLQVYDVYSIIMTIIYSVLFSISFIS